MKFHTSTLIVLNAGLIYCSPLRSAPNLVPIGVEIGTIVATGAGCKGDASWTVSANQSTINFSTPSLISHTSDNLSDRNKTCEFSIPVTYPAGFQYSLQEFSLSGHQKTPTEHTKYTSVASGATTFPGREEDRGVGIGFDAGSEGEYTQEFALWNLWSICGTGNGTQATVDFESNIRIDPSTESGDISIKTGVLRFFWRAC
jgi:hypothetical protein